MSVPAGFDPGTVLVAVDEGANRLEKAADAFHAATLRYENAEALYEREFQRKLLVIFHRHQGKDEDGKARKLPAEDLRKAMAHDLMDADVYGEYLEAKAHKEALSVRYRALSAAVSARQSLLKALGTVGS